jgi:hypothetical protein
VAAPETGRQATGARVYPDGASPWPRVRASLLRAAVAADPETTPAAEASMEGNANASQDPGGPGREERRSLLGTYPTPAPHLVGAPLPPTPGRPSRWRPPPPPLQYGIDYTFLRHHGAGPVRWQPDQPVTVRLCGPHEPEQVTALAAVVNELAGLTGLGLAAGEPWPRHSRPQAVPEQEIHVDFLPALSAVPHFWPCAGRFGLGGALTARGMSYYVSGFVILAASVIDPRSPLAVAALRHELAHALGLGHAARPDLLMYHRLSAATVNFGRGDRYGLSLLNERVRPGTV